MSNAWKYPAEKCERFPCSSASIFSLIKWIQPRSPLLWLSRHGQAKPGPAGGPFTTSLLVRRGWVKLAEQGFIQSPLSWGQFVPADRTGLRVWPHSSAPGKMLLGEQKGCDEHVLVLYEHPNCCCAAPWSCGSAKQDSWWRPGLIETTQTPSIFKFCVFWDMFCFLNITESTQQ